jgi:hypothetical protein
MVQHGSPGSRVSYHVIIVWRALKWQHKTHISAQTHSNMCGLMVSVPAAVIFKCPNMFCRSINCIVYVSPEKSDIMSGV